MRRAGATAKKSGPDLAPDQEDLGPRDKEVVMSAALVLLAGFAHLLRNTSGEASLGGGTPPSSFGQASHLAILCRNENEILGDRKFLTNLERICRGRINTADRGW